MAYIVNTPNLFWRRNRWIADLSAIFLARVPKIVTQSFGMRSDGGDVEFCKPMIFGGF